MDTTKTLWEILVPRFSKRKEYTLDHHKTQDAHVRGIARGVTILRTAKGHWVNPEGTVFVEEMIPVRIHCTKSQIEQIMDHTLAYYHQEAVFAYEVSNNVIIRRKDV